MEGGDDWCLIESDPGVFTELLEKVGCKGVQLEELYSLDEDSLAQLGKVYGLIFLFKWEKEEGSGDREPLSEDDTPPDLFFAHQVTTNACATQAILSIVMNAQDIELGNTLQEFKTFTQSFPPSLKGVSISSSDEIKTAHNSFARQDSFLQEGKLHIPTGDEEAFHFVAYVPVNGIVYELDGLQPGPIIVGAHDEDETSWLSIASNAIQERMSTGKHVKFNLMAVIQDRRISIQQALQGLDENNAEYHELTQQLAHQEQKREAWHKENQRRRHNYVPLCMQLLTELAKAGKLPELVSEAQERVAAKRAKKKASS